MLSTVPIVLCLVTAAVLIPLTSSYKLLIGKHGLPKIKIIFAAYQIISSAAWVAHVDFPFPFSSWTAYLSSLLEFDWVYGIIKCRIRYDYLDKLVFACVFPFGIWLCLVAHKVLFEHESHTFTRMGWTRVRNAVLLHAAHSVAHKNEAENETLTSSAKRLYANLLSRGEQYVSRLFVVVFLFLPTTTVAIVRSYECLELDTELVLLADFSISCTSQKYATMVIFATVWGLVWGMLLGMFLILRKHRNSINPPGLSEQQAYLRRLTLPELVPSATFSSFKPQYWGYEPVELMRRSMMMMPAISRKHFPFAGRTVASSSRCSGEWSSRKSSRGKRPSRHQCCTLAPSAVSVLVPRDRERICELPGMARRS